MIRPIPTAIFQQREGEKTRKAQIRGRVPPLLQEEVLMSDVTEFPLVVAIR